jgi:MFS family permease
VSALAYGFIDGIYQGVSAVVRLLGGWIADRADHPKRVATVGYAVSAVSRASLLAAQTFGAITGVITADRLGKGLRTAPRDALIAASSPLNALGRAYGVHRALDTLGALVGPLMGLPFCTSCRATTDRYSSHHLRSPLLASQYCYYSCQTFVLVGGQGLGRQLILLRPDAYRCGFCAPHSSADSWSQRAFSAC